MSNKYLKEGGKTMSGNKTSEKKLEVKTFTDEKAAVAALMKEKGQYSLRYSLSVKQKTPERIHRSDAWIILPNGVGRCIISVEGCLDEAFELFQNQTTAVLVPAESGYHLEGLSAEIMYSILSKG